MLVVRAVASALIDDALLRRLAAGHRRTVAMPREVAVRARRGEAERVDGYADRIAILPIRVFRRSSRAFM